MTKFDRDRQVAEKLYDLAFVKAQRIVVAGETHVPMILVVTDDDKLTVLGVPNVPKNLLAQFHVIIARQSDVKVALLIMEGWTYQGTDRRIIDAVNRGDLRVADLLEKGEALIFSARVGARQFIALDPIDRATRAVTKKPLVEPGADKGEYGGRFVGSGVNVN